MLTKKIFLTMYHFYINSLMNTFMIKNIHLIKCHESFFHTKHYHNTSVYKNDKLNNCSTYYIFWQNIRSFEVNLNECIMVAVTTKNYDQFISNYATLKTIRYVKVFSCYFWVILNGWHPHTFCFISSFQCYS